MSRPATKEGIGVLGLGAAACAACCAGPVLGFLAALGAGTVIGVAAFGAAALLVAVPVAVVALRRRRATTCVTPDAVPVAAPVRRG